MVVGERDVMEPARPAYGHPLRRRNIARRRVDLFQNIVSLRNRLQVSRRISRRPLRRIGMDPVLSVQDVPLCGRILHFFQIIAKGMGRKLV